MKHNKWCMKNGNIGIIKKKDSGTFVSSKVTIRHVIPAINKPPGAESKIAEKTTPEGSSDCLYTRCATLTNFTFFIISKEHLPNFKTSKGAMIYMEIKNATSAKKFMAGSVMFKSIAKAAINTKKADAKIFTLLKLQKPDFSITGELGVLLLKYATASFLLESCLAFFNKLSVNMSSYRDKFFFYTSFIITQKIS